MTMTTSDWGTPLPTTWVEVDDGRLAATDVGEGPAVILVHAALGDRRMWHHQLRALSRRYRVVAYDCRGAGASDDAVGPFLHHADLVALMDALGLDEAHLVGCSMGGAYCLETALRREGRVRSLTLISPGLYGHQWPSDQVAHIPALLEEAVPADRLRAYRTGRHRPVRPEDVTAMALVQAEVMVAGPSRKAGDVDPVVWSAALEMLEDVFRRMWGAEQFEQVPVPPASERLAELRTPALLINATLDVPWVQGLADELVRRIPRITRVDVEAGHLAPLEVPEEINRHLLAWLSDVDSSAAGPAV